MEPNKMAKSLEFPPNTPDWAIALYSGLSLQIQQATNSLSDKITCIEQSTQKLTSRVDELDTRAENYERNIVIIQHQTSAHDEELSEFREQKSDILSRLQALETHNKTLHDKLLLQEMYSRKLNLLFHGIKEEAWETDTKTESVVRDFIKDTLQTDHSNMKFESVHCIGPRIKKEKPRTIIVRFSNKSDRQSVWTSQKQSRDGKYVTQDFPQEMKQRRSSLIPVYSAAKSMAKYKDKCYLRNDELVIDGHTYKADTLATEPDNDSNATERWFHLFLG
jgi:TolA-binding protein